MWCKVIISFLIYSYFCIKKFTWLCFWHDNVKRLMGYDIILKNTVTGTARGSEDVRVGVSDRLIPIVLFNNFKLIVARKSLCRMSVRHMRADGRICYFCPFHRCCGAIWHCLTDMKTAFAARKSLFGLTGKPLWQCWKAFPVMRKSLFRESEEAFPRRCFSEKNSVTVCSGLTYNG